MYHSPSCPVCLDTHLSRLIFVLLSSDCIIPLLCLPLRPPSSLCTFFFCCCCFLLSFFFQPAQHTCLLPLISLALQIDLSKIATHNFDGFVVDVVDSGLCAFLILTIAYLWHSLYLPSKFRTTWKCLIAFSISRPSKHSWRATSKFSLIAWMEVCMYASLGCY